MLPRLRVESRDQSSPINDYRIRDGMVELRTLRPNGERFPNGSDWTRLTDEEVQLHDALNTAVAVWLRAETAPRIRAAI
jgi:hypothetical protein